MLKLSKLAAVLAAALFAVMWAMPAQAQATRTWVSGVGDDANPCSRTAPCKTFAGAISKTASGGEIDCLDPGGFGAVTITKSLSLVCDAFTKGGVLVSGTNGIVVSGAGINVVLKGLDVEGLGTGLNGVSFVNGASLTVEDCEFRDFDGAGVTNGNGISFTPTGTAILTVTNSRFYNQGSLNGSNPVGNAILLRPGSGGTVQATVDHVVATNNKNGLTLDTTTSGATGNSAVTISDSTFANSAGEDVLASAPSNSIQAVVTLNRAIITNAGDRGLYAVGTGAQILFGSSVVTRNNTGVTGTGGGAVVSYGNNQFDGNTTAGTLTATIATK